MAVNKKSFKYIIILIIFFLSLQSISAQGNPPAKGNQSPSDAGGGGPTPPDTGAPLDSNAIYVLIGGGFLFLVYTYRKKLLASLNQSE